MQKVKLPDDLIGWIQNLYTSAGFTITMPVYKESESAEYGACRFGLNGKTIVFRVAKTTPNKTGQFVTLWKRAKQGDKIAPLDTSDKVDFIVVSVFDKTNLGQFVFDQKILVEKGILSQNSQGGKRGFRLYPPWTNPLSMQALKTQKWQSFYFVSFSQEGIINIDEVQKAFKHIIQRQGALTDEV